MMRSSTINKSVTCRDIGLDRSSFEAKFIYFTTYLISCPTISQAATELQDIIASSHRLLYSTFTAPGVLYFKLTRAIEIELSLKKLHATETTEDATIDTANKLTNETSVDNALLKSLVTDSVATATKKMKNEIGQLKKQLALKKTQTPASAVNGRRGQPPPGASSTKKKSQRKKTPAQKVGAVANASTRKPRSKKEKDEKKKKTLRK